MAIKTSISLPDDLHWGLKDAARERRINETAALRLALSEFIAATVTKGSGLVPKTAEVPVASESGSSQVTSGDSFGTSVYDAEHQQAHDVLERILRDGPQVFTVAILNNLKAFEAAAYLAKLHGFKRDSDTFDEGFSALVERSRGTVARARRSLNNQNPAGKGDPQKKEGSAPRTRPKRAS